MRHLDLFSGIGGFALGLERAGFETVGFCEIDKFCQKVLKKHWPDVPIYEDIRELNAETLANAERKQDNRKRGDCGLNRADVGWAREATQQKNWQANTNDFDGHGKNAITADIITGGYPCQPFSVAGKQRGHEDERHLWPEMFRVIQTVRPRWVIAENVAGHIQLGLDTVLSQMEDEGYTCWPFVIPACAVGAPHRRDRVWVVANAKSTEQQLARNTRTGRRGFTNSSKNVADTTSTRQQGQGKPIQRSGETQDEEGQADNVESMCVGSQWATEPGVGVCFDGVSARLDGGRLNGQTRNTSSTEELLELWERVSPQAIQRAEDGAARIAMKVPNRIHRLRVLGNSIVPQIAELIGLAIMEHERGSL